MGYLWNGPDLMAALQQMLLAGRTRFETFEANNGTNLGNMTSGGGLAVAFNGSIEADAGSARLVGANGYVGKTYGGSKAINRAICKSPTDVNYCNVVSTVTLTLYGKNGVPSSGTDGTILGTVTGISAVGSGGRTDTITSSDNNTTYTNVWVYVSSNSGAGAVSIAELEIYSIA